ncbi:hypothetical protein R5R35_008296 [Gryllus longicercus]|uniref:Cuticular protein n=1 Tax=Gryllus longicercus TaxID=2509291 RepID=A0AAN9ZA49_9ORTH
MCAVLVAGGPWAAAGPAAVALGAVRPPTASLQRLTEAELGAYHEIDHQGPGTYVFGYDVDDPETGNSQFRQEERHPNGTVTGSYGLVLPDGSIQIVHYTADHLGYRARIETKKPEAQHRLYGASEPQATAPAFRTQPPPPPPREQVPPRAPGEFEPVFWLPAPAAAPPFSVNYV